MRTLLILFVCIFSFSGFLSAQTTKTLTWTNYNLRFQAPGDMIVRENSSIVFSGGNGSVFISLYPGKGDTVRYDNMPANLKNWARDNKVEFQESSASYYTGFDSYSAYKIDGTAYRGRSATLLLLVDKGNPGISFYAWVQYENGYSTMAQNMLNTFKRL